MADFVILVNLGGPSSPAEVKSFLFRMFSDKNLIRTPFSESLQMVLAGIITRIRTNKTKKMYDAIGWDSPLLRITENQAKLIKKILNEQELDTEVRWAMMYSEPLLDDVLRKIKEYIEDDTRIIIVPMFPHYSYSTTGAIEKKLEILAKRYRISQKKIHFIRSFHLEQGYIDHYVSNIKDIGPQEEDVVIFSAHSIPYRQIKRGDPYENQVKETVKRIVERTSLDFNYRLGFQSKVGPIEWLGPSLKEVVNKCIAEDFKRIIIVPISFVTENLETLYELDIMFKKKIENAKVDYIRLPCHNEDSGLAKSLADLIEAKLKIGSEICEM